MKPDAECLFDQASVGFDLWSARGTAKLKGMLQKSVCVCATSWSSKQQQINGCYSIPGQGVAQGTNTESQTRVQGDEERVKEFFYVTLNTVHIFVATWQATA